MIKFQYWEHDLMDNYPRIYDKMEQLIQELLTMNFIEKKKELIVVVEIDEEHDLEVIEKKVLQHELRFKYKYEYFSQKHNELLLQYLCTKGNDWQLNDQTLKQLYLYFNNKFSTKLLKRKCFEYGCDFQ